MTDVLAVMTVRVFSSREERLSTNVLSSPITCVCGHPSGRSLRNAYSMRNLRSLMAYSRSRGVCWTALRSTLAQSVMRATSHTAHSSRLLPVAAAMAVSRCSLISSLVASGGMPCSWIAYSEVNTLFASLTSLIAFTRVRKRRTPRNSSTEKSASSNPATVFIVLHPSSRHSERAAMDNWSNAVG